MPLDFYLPSFANELQGISLDALHKLSEEKVASTAWRRNADLVKEVPEDGGAPTYRYKSKGGKTLAQMSMSPTHAQTSVSLVQAGRIPGSGRKLIGDVTRLQGTLGTGDRVSASGEKATRKLGRSGFFQLSEHPETTQQVSSLMGKETLTRFAPAGEDVFRLVSKVRQLPRNLRLVKSAAKVSPEEKAERHFSSPSPDWKAFEKNLRGKPFRETVKRHPQADEKLKKYVNNFGGHLASKDLVAEVKSGDSGRTYKVKRLPNGRLTCSCGDWQFKKSVGRGNCKHIKSLKQSGMLKESGIIDTALVKGTTMAFAGRRAKKEREHYQVAREMKRQIGENDMQKRLQRMYGS